MSHIDTLFDQARHQSARSPLWDELRRAQATELPTCVNHPGRLAVGGFDDHFYCAECVGWEIRIRRCSRATNGREEV